MPDVQRVLPPSVLALPSACQPAAQARVTSTLACAAGWQGFSDSSDFDDWEASESRKLIFVHCVLLTTDEVGSIFDPGVSGTPAPQPPGWDILGRLRFALA